MNCTREEEVMAAIAAGRWPDGCVELRAHVDGCASCADLVLVATAILADQAVVVRRVHVPSSGLVWWRAQRRLRAEAVRAASRAVTAVQALSVIGAVAVAFAIIAAMAIDWQMVLIRVENTLDLRAWTIPLGVAVSMGLTITPVALYLAFAKE